MGVIIEFAGLPGAGKTSLSQDLIKYLGSSSTVISRKDAVVNCVRRRNDGAIKNFIKKLPPSAWRPIIENSIFFNAFITCSSLHLEFISFVCRHLGEGKIDAWLTESIWHTFIKSFAESGLISTHGTNTEHVIMDEAFAQRCFTLFGYMEKKMDSNIFSRYAALAPIAPFVFWIDTSPAVCIDRLKIRYNDRSSPYELDSPKLLDYFQMGRQILEHLCIALKAKGKTVYIINGDTSRKEAADKMIASNFHECYKI